MANKGEHITQSHAQDNRNYLPTQSSADMLLGNPCFRFSSPPGRQPKSPTRITPIKILHQYWLNDNGAVGNNQARSLVIHSVPAVTSLSAGCAGFLLLIHQIAPQVIRPTASIMPKIDHQSIVCDTVNSPLNPATSTSYCP